MKPSTPFLRREVTAIPSWVETCGRIRPFIEEQDGAAAEVHHLEITGAKLHSHERPDEIHYVLEGAERMRDGVMVKVPRGVRNDVHKLESPPCPAALKR